MATQNSEKRTFAESYDASGDLISNKHLRDSSSTEECEETDCILSPNSRWEAIECLEQLLESTDQPLKRFERRSILK